MEESLAMSRPKTWISYFIKEGEDIPKPQYDEAIMIVKLRFKIFFQHEFNAYKDPFLCTPLIESNKRDLADFMVMKN